MPNQRAVREPATRREKCLDRYEYGDVTLITTGGKIFGAVITVMGVGKVALPTGIIASGFSNHIRIRSDQFQAQADLALEDGILTDDEKMDLEQLRESMGLSEHSASQILGTEKARSMLRESNATDSSVCGNCGHCPD